MRKVLLLTILTMVVTLVQASPFYCPKTSNFIKPGMNIIQVSQACGEPVSRQKTKKSGVRQVPVKQLIFRISGRDKGRGVVRYGKATESGLLIVSLSKNKVVNIQMDGMSLSNATVCDGNSISMGDNEIAVTNACGNPSYTNMTTKAVSTGTTNEVEVWKIKTDDYSPPVTLTFTNGVLESISK